MSQPTFLSLARTVKYLIWRLTGWAQDKVYGEIVIVVNKGQISFIRENVSYTDGILPDSVIPQDVTDAAQRVIATLADQ